MRAIIHRHGLYAIALVAAAFLSCNRREIDGGTTISCTTQQELTLSAMDTVILFEVKCPTPWEAAVEDPSWGEILVTDIRDGVGGKFKLITRVNHNETPRENSVIVTSGIESVQKTITQEGLGNFFNPRMVNMTDVREASVYFNSPSPWSASVDSGKDWLSLKTISGEKGKSTLIVTSKDLNENIGQRDGSILVSIGKHSFIIPVLQGQRDAILLAGDSTTEFPFPSCTFIIFTTYNVPYLVSVSEPWITHVDSKAPSQNSTETFFLEENSSRSSRKALITFQCESNPAVSATVTVIQLGKDSILDVTDAGIYGMGELDVVKGENGWNQTSAIYSRSGNNRFRFINAKGIKVIELSGIPKSARINDSFQVSATIWDGWKTALKDSRKVSLIGESDQLYWLKESENSYMIIEK